MTDAAGISRRGILVAPMILGLTGAACAQKNETTRMKSAKILIAYLPFGKHAGMGHYDL
jgi:hypothetical protein